MGRLIEADRRATLTKITTGSMDQSCLVTTVQAGGGVMVWGMFSWYTLGPL